MTLRVFDPPQCCSTGVCGPDIDPALVQFAADLKALAARGVAVERFNLSQEPEAFVAQEVVRTAINTLGTGVLPLIVRDGRIVSHGCYPTLATLEAIVADATEAEPAEMLSLDIASDCAPGSGCC